jgi:aerobic-type carbon monoxide dehydrogenase small subunit (CoxS/CutS family)
MIKNVNGKARAIEVAPDAPLLWLVRERLGHTETQFGCHIAQCGACTAHLDGEAVRSCVTPVARAAVKEVMTIDGLDHDVGHPLREAWIAEDVPQRRYCQSGQIMAAGVLFRETCLPTEQDIDGCMAGNACRYGTYLRIRRAIHRAARTLSDGGQG